MTDLRHFSRSGPRCSSARTTHLGVETCEVLANLDIARAFDRFGDRANLVARKTIKLLVKKADHTAPLTKRSNPKHAQKRGQVQLVDRDLIATPRFDSTKQRRVGRGDFVALLEVLFFGFIVEFGGYPTGFRQPTRRHDLNQRACNITIVGFTAEPEFVANSFGFFRTQTRGQRSDETIDLRLEA